MVKVGFMGSMWLGVRALELLASSPNVEITAVSMPPRTREVWWSDVVDEDYVEDLGFTNSSPREVLATQPELVFSVQNGYLFSDTEINAVPGGIVNLHPAPLPYYRGMIAYPHAITNADDFFGATLHYVDPGIDTGPIIGRKWLPIDENDTGRSLYRKTMPVALDLFEQFLEPVVVAAGDGGRVRTMRQLDKRSRYYSRGSIADKTLDGLSSSQRERKIRALTFPPHLPPTVTTGDGQEQYWAFDRQTSRFISENLCWSQWGSNVDPEP